MMKLSEIASAGTFFYDLEIGRLYESPTREVNQSDIGMFQDLECNPFTTHGEGRPAHGLLAATIAVGLVGASGVTADAALAMVSFEWRCLEPIMAGDRLHVVWSVADKRLVRTRDRGLVTQSMTLLRGQEVVGSGSRLSLWRLEPLSADVSTNVEY